MTHGRWNGLNLNDSWDGDSLSASINLLASLSVRKEELFWIHGMFLKFLSKRPFFFFSLLSCFSEEISLPNCSKKLFWDRDIHLCVRPVLVKQSTKPFFHLIHINYLSAAPLWFLLIPGTRNLCGCILNKPEPFTPHLVSQHSKNKNK